MLGSGTLKTPHMVIEHIHDSPKVNVWCGLLHDCLVGLFFVAEDTVTCQSCTNDSWSCRNDDKEPHRDIKNQPWEYYDKQTTIHYAITENIFYSFILPS